MSTWARAVVVNFKRIRQGAGGAVLSDVVIVYIDSKWRME